MERRPYPVGRVGCACGCRMVDVAEAGAGWRDTEPAEDLVGGASALRGESNGHGVRKLRRDCDGVHVAGWDYGADSR